MKRFALTFAVTALLAASVLLTLPSPALAQQPQGTPPPTQPPAAASGWKYDAILYGWFCGLKGTIGVADVLENPVDATFDDLAGFVDFAMAGHFEAKNASAVLIGDLSYIDLSAERDAEVRNQTVEVGLDITQWIAELGGGYRVTPEFDVLVVGRYYFLEMGGTAESILGESAGGASENWGDIYLGARYNKTLAQKWLLSIRGDIGAGGSDFAWFGNAAVGYHFTDAITGLLSYRILGLDREGDTQGDYFKYDITQDGLGLGLGFGF